MARCHFGYIIEAFVNLFVSFWRSLPKINRGSKAQSKSNLILMCFQWRWDIPNLKAEGGNDVYLESISFDTSGFEEVVVGVEACEFGREHRKFDQSILSQRQFLQQG